MNKDIYRNIAAVTAIFIISLSVMLITNYFQVRGVTPLQTEVVETLKLLNDTNPDNPELQEQIRQLDLLARRAYFIQADHLKLGVYILLGMWNTPIVSPLFSRSSVSRSSRGTESSLKSGTRQRAYSSASCMTVRVFKPRKSIFKSPTS